MGVSKRSITLQWNEPPPDLTGNPPRNITQYAVTVSPQDGGNPHVQFVPAKAGAVCFITNLQTTMAYDIKVEVVIDTERQGEQTYDIGPPQFTVTTGSE